MTISATANNSTDRLLEALRRRFDVRGVIGHGGQGSVYEVTRRQEPDRVLALKLVRGDRAPSRSAVEALRREFEVLTRLAHPSLARVYEFGSLLDGEAVYFTAERIDGVDLSTWCLEHSFEEYRDATLSLVVQGLGALAALHRQGCFHGDLKPSNLLVEPVSVVRSASRSSPARCWRLQLIDFGGARWRGLVGSPDRWSTPLYRPPASLADGKAAEDLFRFGLAFFHALAGRLPFSPGDVRAQEVWLDGGANLALREYVSSAPRALDELLRRLTTSQRERRFSSATEAIEFLRQAVTVTLPDSGPPAAPAQLHGRDREVGELLSSVVSPRPDSAAPVVFVEGPRGAGKRAVLDALQARLQLEDYRTVRVESGQLQRALGELSQIAAELGRYTPGPVGLARGSASDLSPAEQCVRWLSLLERFPVALLVHDVEETRDGSRSTADRELLLSTLRHREATSGGLCAVVAVADPDSLPAPSRSLRSRCTRVRLDGLDEAGCAAMASEFFCSDQVPARVITALRERTGGWPRRLWSALQALQRAGARLDATGCLELPGEWERALEHAPAEEGREDSDLDAVERAALRCLEAVDGMALEPIEVELLLRESGDTGDGRSRSSRPVAEALRALFWKGRLAKSRRNDARGTRYCALASSSSQRTLQDDDRRLVEAFARLLKAGSIVIEVTDPRRAEPAARVLLRAGSLVAAARLALAAARSLVRCQLPRDAVRLVEEIALDEAAWTGSRKHRWRDALLLRAAAISGALGDTPAAQRCLDSLSSECRGLRLRAARYLRARCASDRGDKSEAAALVESLVAESAERGCRTSCASDPLVALLARLRFESGDREGGESTLARARRSLEREIDPGDDVSVAAIVARTRWATIESDFGDAGRAEILARSAAAAARRLGRFDLEEPALHELATLRARRAAFDEAESAFLRCQEIADDRGDVLAWLRAQVNRATLRYRAGRWSEAELLYREARGVSESLGPNRCHVPILVGLGVLARESGELLGALRLARQVVRAVEREAPSSRSNAFYNLGEIQFALGRPHRALAAREEALRAARQGESRAVLQRARVGLALLHAELGACEVAGQLLADAEVVASASPARENASLALLEALIAIGRLDTTPTISVWRTLFAAVRASLRQDDRARFERSVVALVETLLRGSRRSFATILLRWAHRRLASWPGAQRSATAVRRLPGVWRVLEWIAAGELSRREADLRELLDDLDASAERWQALRAVALATRHGQDTGVSPVTRRQFRRDTEARFHRILRRMDRDSWPRVAELLAGHELARRVERSARRSESEPLGSREATGGDEASSVGANSPLDRVLECLRHWAATVSPATDADTSTGLEVDWEQELERLRQALGAASLWLLTCGVAARAGRVEALPSRADREAPLPPAASSAGQIEGVCARDRPRWSGRGVLLPLPWRCPEEGSSTAASSDPLHAALDVTWDDERLAAAMRDEIALPLAAAATSLLFSVDRLARSLASSRQQGDELSGSLRELHATLSRRDSQIETAVLSWRQPAVEVRRALGESVLEEDVPAGWQSAAMRRLLEQVRRVARTELPVLVVGEPGSGKDFVARLIHGSSARRDGPFWGQVCQVPESLLESELFGAAEGAFTGAESSRRGILQTCHGGTLYFDHIDELPLAVQGKLLRVLDERQVRKLGSEELEPIDVRVIASSTGSPQELGERGVLRRDLLYRLQGAVIEVPPLRERLEDMEEIFHGFVVRTCRELSIPLPELAPGVIEFLRAQSWPGNLRQLQSVVVRALLRAPRRLTIESLEGGYVVPESASERAGEPSVAAGEAAPLPTLQAARAGLERELLERALCLCDGNATRAARRLGISRRHMGTLLSRHGLDPRDFRR